MIPSLEPVKSCTECKNYIQGKWTQDVLIVLYTPSKCAKYDRIIQCAEKSVCGGYEHSSEVD